MSNIESRTEPGTHDKFKMGPLFDSIVAQDHIRSEFFSKLLEMVRVRDALKGSRTKLVL